MYSANTVESLAFVNAPYIYEDICVIHPLTVSNVLTLQSNYDIHLQILTLSRIDITGIFKQKGFEIAPSEVPQPFDYILDSAERDDKFLLELKNAFRTFIKEEVIILFDLRQIIIGSPVEKRILNSSNFSEFQNIIRLQNKMTEVEIIPENESPQARKFREKRELRDAVKKNQNKTEETSFSTLISALCSYGIGITPFNIGDLSMFAFHSLLNINGDKERFYIEMNYLFAGADPKKLKPKHWITKQ